MRSHTSVETMSLIVIVPYSFVPLLMPFLYTMRHSVLAVFMFEFHCLFYWVRASALIFLTRASFRGLWWNSWLSVGSIAALFASVSARLLLLIPECPGIHIITIRSCGRWFVILSMLSRISCMIIWSDCLHGLAITFMATWLSVYIWHRGSSLLCSSISTPRCSALSSATSMFC